MPVSVSMFMKHLKYAIINFSILYISSENQQLKLRRALLTFGNELGLPQNWRHHVEWWGVSESFVRERRVVQQGFKDVFIHIEVESPNQSAHNGRMFGGGFFLCGSPGPALELIPIGSACFFLRALSVAAGGRT